MSIEQHPLYAPTVEMQMTWKKVQSVLECHEGAEVVGVLIETKTGRALVKGGKVTWPNPHQAIRDPEEKE